MGHDTEQSKAARSCSQMVRISDFLKLPVRVYIFNCPDIIGNSPMPGASTMTDWTIDATNGHPVHCKQIVIRNRYCLLLYQDDVNRERPFISFSCPKTKSFVSDRDPDTTQAL